jgi:ubiquinol oxidase
VLYHPVYAKEEVRKVKVVHFDNQTLGDKFASALVKVFRKGFDIVTGYKHVDLKAAMEKAEKEGRKGMSLKEMRERGLVMTPEQWLAVSFAHTIVDLS